MSLGNEQFMRTLDIGDNWRIVRIGMRYSIQAPQDTIWMSQTMGMCYQRRGWFDASCHFIGYNWGATTGTYPWLQQYSYAAGPPQSYNGSSNSSRGIARVGSTTTLAGSTSVGHYIPYLRKGIQGLYIDRTGGPNSFVFYYFVSANTVDAGDYSQAQFITFLETQSPTPSYTAGPFTVNYTSPGTPLDTFYYANYSEVPRVAVWDVGVSRIL